uniref:Immunoglobulin V-set domain-containing protein n=1 Tax=Electrophorus electricus TaxID=8005 RepID=A0A4W4E3W1_ELEEL
EVKNLLSEAVVKTPGEAYKLICTASGFTFSSYWASVVRQVPEKGLEWVAAISTSSSYIYFFQSVQGRFTLSREDSITLKGQNLQHEDTAVCYCATSSQLNGLGTLKMKAWCIATNLFQVA